MTTPLTPSDCDLKDFNFIPIEGRRLLTSETWVLGSGEQKAAAMSLWIESWYQLPAASLPNIEKMLAHLSRAKSWKQVKEHALRGWVLCSDGRLYHPVMAEKALEAWLEKLAARFSGAEGNLKRWGMPFDRASLEAAITTARAMLTSLNPQSRALSKRKHYWMQKVSPPDSGADSQPDSPPDTHPDSGGESPPQSGRGRKGQGQGYIKSERERRERDPVPPEVRPERWQAYCDQLGEDGRQSAPRVMLAIGQLRVLVAQGLDPNAVLEAAVMRGLRDLADVGRRLQTEAQMAEKARGSPAGLQGKNAQAIAKLEAMKHENQIETESRGTLVPQSHFGGAAKAALPGA